MELEVQYCYVLCLCVHQTTVEVGVAVVVAVADLRFTRSRSSELGARLAGVRYLLNFRLIYCEGRVGWLTCLNG